MGSKVFGVLAKHTLALLFILLAIPVVAVAQIDVWIDPGHGGGDPGNLGFSGDPDAYEKVLTLEVSGVLGSRLGQIGFSSLKTRNSGDNYLICSSARKWPTGLSRTISASRNQGRCSLASI